jgi:hypothetical protein
MRAEEESYVSPLEPGHCWLASNLVPILRAYPSPEEVFSLNLSKKMAGGSTGLHPISRPQRTQYKLASFYHIASPQVGTKVERAPDLTQI